MIFFNTAYTHLSRHQISVVERMKGDDVKYWLNEKGVLQVPKRDLKEIISGTVTRR